MREVKNRTFWYWNEELNEKIMGMIIEEATDKEGKLEQVKELLWDFDHRFMDKFLTGIPNILGYTQPEALVRLNNELRDIIEIA